MLIFLFQKKKNNAVFILFPFDDFTAWKEYISLFRSFAKETSFSETCQLLYYKYRTTKNQNHHALPYFKFPQIDSDKMFYDAEQFPELNSLLKHKEEILQEYYHASKYLKSYVDEAGNVHADWQTIFLYMSGNLNEKICDKFPVTLGLLNTIKGIDYSMILFSALKPNAYIPPHTGPFNVFLRVHLPLIVPKENQNCSITVGTATNYWQEDKLMIFDDSYLHSVSNNTDETRVVLLLAVEKRNVRNEIINLTHQFINLLNKSIPFKQWIWNNA